VTACIGEPISWLRLEQFALGAADPAISSHLAGCPACRRCLDTIAGDAIELPRLVVPVAPRRGTRRRWWLAPALAAAAAAVVLGVVLRPPLRPQPGPDAALRVAIKGVGELALELVRERGGAIAYDARSFAPGDRWKLVVSCPPGAAPAPIAIDVSVADGISVDHPVAAAQLACGNRVVVPGAFAITGDRPNRVCVRIGAGPDAATACATLVPEAAAPGPR